MAYTRVWDNAAPPGTAPANTLDTIIQQFREDTQQRISSILLAGTDIDDDPLQLNATITGGQTARVLTFGPHLFQSVDDEDDISRQPAYVQSDNDGAVMFASFLIPLGYEITRWEVTLDRQGGASASAQLYANNVQAGSAASISGPLVRVAGGIGTVFSVIAHTVVSNEAFTIQVYGAGGGQRYRVYGFRITVDRASSALSY